MKRMLKPETTSALRRLKRSSRIALLQLLLVASLSAVLPSNAGLAYAWTNFAGQPGGPGNADGTGSAARFSNPFSVATDSGGNVYVADYYNHTIRKVSPTGTVTTLAGTAKGYGSADGMGQAAQFLFPSGVAADSAGNLYVADTGNHTIRKVTPTGMVTTLAGNAGASGSADGLGSAARFNQPIGVAVDTVGIVYVADQDNHTIRKVTPAGMVSTLAGSAGTFGSVDGTNVAARFYYPSGVAVDNAGNVYVADSSNLTLRKVTPAGVVTTLAGSAGMGGSMDGTGSAARFWNPSGVAVDSAGNVYVADSFGSTIRKVTAAGVVTTLAGSPGIQGAADGTGSAARFYKPEGVAVDNSRGVLYVADTWNHTIRKVTSGGMVTTLAGSPLADSPYSGGSVDGAGNAAHFWNPSGVAVDNSGIAYVADQYNHTIRKVTTNGVVTTLAGSAGADGSTDGTGDAARFYYPSGVAVDNGGNVYVADSGNDTIRKVTPAGVVTTLAGTAGAPGSADGTGNAARFYLPSGVAVDSSGIVYVADTINHTIRKVTPAGVVTTLAGSAGVSGNSDGTGSAARFNRPSGVALDNCGAIYVTDTFNYAIRKVTPDGAVMTLTGNSNLVGSLAGISVPAGIAVDSAGTIYVADIADQIIRKVTPSGFVTTLAGTPGVRGGADGIGPSAKFSDPAGIAVDRAGNLFVADQGNNRITKGTPLFPAFGSGTVNAFDYADFNNVSQLNLLNATLQVSNRVRLTSATTFQTGTIYHAAKLRLREGFETTFSFVISNPGGVPDAAGNLGGDGFAFIIQKQGATVTGSAVGYIPYSIPDALVVEFDTWQNTNLGDPNGNHLSVQNIGPLPDGLTEFNQSRSLGWATPAFNLSDEVVHTARICYAGGLLAVFLDGDPAPALSLPLNLENLACRSALDADGMAWVGFAAGTAAAYETHDILNWSLQLIVPPRPTIHTSGGRLYLAWQAAAADFILQSATTLANGGDWHDSNLTATVSNGQMIVSLPSIGPCSFFRLRSP